MSWPASTWASVMAQTIVKLTYPVILKLDLPVDATIVSPVQGKSNIDTDYSPPIRSASPLPRLITVRERTMTSGPSRNRYIQTSLKEMFLDQHLFMSGNQHRMCYGQSKLLFLHNLSDVYIF